jgi:hypothetical protein
MLELKIECQGKSDKVMFSDALLEEAAWGKKEKAKLKQVVGEYLDFWLAHIAKQQPA